LKSEFAIENYPSSLILSKKIPEFDIEKEVDYKFLIVLSKVKRHGHAQLMFCD
jgi:hypothetical protein